MAGISCRILMPRCGIRALRPMSKLAHALA
jgi:hypothetical protein